MTEAEWLVCTDPKPMWVYLHYNGGSFRKLRLLACACLRRIWHLLTDERCRKAVEVAERDAEGLATEADVFAALDMGRDGWHAQAEAADDGHYSTPLLRAMPDAGLAAYDAIDADWQCIGNAARAAAYFAAPAERDFAAALSDPAWVAANDHESRIQAGLIRCIFGNPFHPRPRLPAALLGWNDGTIPKIARGIYEERAFDRLPVLHDALLDAGCDDEAILSHCREAGRHVRGCWVIDLLLGKE